MRANLNALEELLNWVTNQLENHKDEAKFIPDLLEELHWKRASVYYIGNETDEIGIFEIGCALISVGTPTKRRKNREIAQEVIPTPMVVVN